MAQTSHFGGSQVPSQPSALQKPEKKKLKRPALMLKLSDEEDRGKPLTSGQQNNEN